MSTWILPSDLTDDLLSRFHQAGEIAWDIETSGLDFVADSIGTVQLHSPKVGSALIQMSGSPPSNLKLLLSSRQVRKVFHHAPFDLRFMYSIWDCWPQNVACTKIASKMLRPHATPKSHSLKPLLSEHLGIELDKSRQVSDWTAAKLDKGQIDYAFNDVRYLLDLYGELSKKVDDQGLTPLYSRCLEFLPTRVVMDVGGWPDVFLY